MKPKRWGQWRAVGVAVLMLCSCGMLAGCGAIIAGAAAGAGAVAYMRGELETTEAAPIGDVFVATKAVVDELPG